MPVLSNPRHERFKWQALDEWYDEGAARYMAHARQQMADGLLEHAGCSLRKAAHKARQARRLREIMLPMFGSRALDRY